MENKQETGFGLRLRGERKRIGLTQSELAAACGLGRRFLLELEAGKATSHLGKVLQVLTALGVSLQAVDRKGDL